MKPLGNETIGGDAHLCLYAGAMLGSPSHRHQITVAGELMFGCYSEETQPWLEHLLLEEHPQTMLHSEVVVTASGSVHLHLPLAVHNHFHIAGSVASGKMTSLLAFAPATILIHGAPALTMDALITVQSGSTLRLEGDITLRGTIATASSGSEVAIGTWAMIMLQPPMYWPHVPHTVTAIAATWSDACDALYMQVWDTEQPETPAALRAHLVESGWAHDSLLETDAVSTCAMLYYAALHLIQGSDEWQLQDLADDTKLEAALDAAPMEHSPASIAERLWMVGMYAAREVPELKETVTLAVGKDSWLTVAAYSELHLHGNSSVHGHVNFHAMSNLTIGDAVTVDCSSIGAVQRSPDHVQLPFISAKDLSLLVLDTAQVQGLMLANTATLRVARRPFVCSSMLCSVESHHSVFGWAHVAVHGGAHLSLHHGVALESSWLEVASGATLTLRSAGQVTLPQASRVLLHGGLVLVDTSANLKGLHSSSTGFIVSRKHEQSSISVTLHAGSSGSTWEFPSSAKTRHIAAALKESLLSMWFPPSTALQEVNTVMSSWGFETPFTAMPEAKEGLYSFLRTQQMCRSFLWDAYNGGVLTSIPPASNNPAAMIDEALMAMLPANISELLVEQTYPNAVTACAAMAAVRRIAIKHGWHAVAEPRLTYTAFSGVMKHLGLSAPQRRMLRSRSLSTSAMMQQMTSVHQTVDSQMKMKAEQASMHLLGGSGLSIAAGSKVKLPGNLMASDGTAITVASGAEVWMMAPSHTSSYMSQYSTGNVYGHVYASGSLPLHTMNVNSNAMLSLASNVTVNGNVVLAPNATMAATCSFMNATFMCPVMNVGGNFAAGSAQLAVTFSNFNSTIDKPSKARSFLGFVAARTSSSTFASVTVSEDAAKYVVVPTSGTVEAAAQEEEAYNRPPPAPPADEGSGSGGAIAGAVIGVLLVAAAVVFFIMYRRRYDCGLALPSHCRCSFIALCSPCCPLLNLSCCVAGRGA